MSEPTFHSSSALAACLFALAAMCLVSACDSFTTHDELSLKKRPFRGDQLRMNGYYYFRYSVSEGSRYSTYFFYRNGVVRYVGSFKSLDSLSNQDFLDGDARHQWGLSRVDGEQIAFERWYPPSKTHTQAFIRSGRILNDTTFVITESRRSNGGERREEGETYRFRRFSPKPDSTTGYLD